MKEKMQLCLGDNAVTSDIVVERDIVINEMKIHVKSIFSGKVSLEKAMSNIILRKSNGEQKAV